MARERYGIADLTVDVEAVSVRRSSGEEVPLPGLSFDLLVTLARRAPAVVGADELIATVWNGAAVSDETLTQRVALLRRALGDDAKSPRYLRAVRGRGYQLIPAAVSIGDGGHRASEAVPVPPRRRIGRVARWVIGTLTVLEIGVLLLIPLARHRKPAAAAVKPAAVTTRSPSVAELLSRAGSYLGQHQQANNELAIELYQRALRREPRNPQALAGLSLALGQRATKFNQRGDSGSQAMELARQALALDPRLGRAHHALGLALDSRGEITPALAAYRRAAELEPDPAAALASAANLLQVQGHLADALETDLRAAKLGGDPPIYLEVQIAATLALLGFDRAAEVWFERALELRPDNVFAAADYARLRLSQGRFADADALAARALQRGIRRPELAAIRGSVALAAGDPAQAKARFAEALAIEPGYGPARARLLRLGPPQPGAYRKLLDELRQDRAEGDEWPDGSLDEALLETGLGDRPAALQALDRAIALGYRDAAWLERDPLLASLREDPGFSRRIAAIRRLIETERQRVAGAPWLPPALLEGNAARM
jgi:DNA-binding winged helix-turn-helix (wHTH) protein/tetratricopeptide (TPR) repeat protein